MFYLTTVMEEPRSYVSPSLIKTLERNIRTTRDKFPHLNVVDAGPDYESDDDASSNDPKET